jgi:hypothetical protein
MQQLIQELKNEFQAESAGRETYMPFSFYCIQETLPHAKNAAPLS